MKCSIISLLFYTYIEELKMRLNVLKSQYEGKIAKLKQQIQQQTSNEGIVKETSASNVTEPKLEDTQRPIGREIPKRSSGATEQSKQVQTSDRPDSDMKPTTTIKLSKEPAPTEQGGNLKPQVRPQIKRVLGNQKVKY